MAPLKSFQCVVFFIALTTFRVAMARSYLQTNEVVEKHDHSRSILGLPVCSSNAVCGYLQANSQGINVQQRCACSQGARCPLKWDSSDGHSVTQGSDQYKFCGPAPVLSPCSEGMTAYTSRLVFTRETEELLETTDNIQCICPENHKYLIAHQAFDNPDEETEGMDLTYTCAPLETCEAGDYCKTVSETSTEFLVQRKCVCPQGLRCPTTTNTGIKTTPMGNGFAHFIRCQR